jgi:type II secretory pathway pseudopilin PulG
MRRPAPRPAAFEGPREAAGATLIEILIVMAITGLVAGGLFSFFLATSRTYSDQAINARMLQNASTAMTWIAQDIRRAGTFWSLPCALEALISATNGPPGRITVRLMLDDPAVRTEVAPPPPAGQFMTTTVLRVVSTAGFQNGDTAFITDGVQCTRFTVTQIIGGATPGLEHNPAGDLHSPGGAGYLYPAATSLVYKLGTNQQVTYTIDSSNPSGPWLTRNVGSGALKLSPDIESVRFAYVMADGTTVADPATVTTAAQAANIRMVIVSVTVRADRRSLGVGGDGFRRQTLTSRVQLRNLGP